MVLSARHEWHRSFALHSTIPALIGAVELQGMVLSAINGIGLSLVIPNAQSITADYYDELDRGKAFGALYMTSALGGAFGSLYATNQGMLQTAVPAYHCPCPAHCGGLL